VQATAIVHTPVTTAGAVELARIHEHGNDMGDAPGCQNAIAEEARKLGANVVYVTHSKVGIFPYCYGTAYWVPDAPVEAASLP
jgi:hypothetical protein